MKKSYQEIFNLVKEAAVEQNLKIDFAKVHKSVTMRELGIDSLSAIAIIDHVENRLNVRIKDEELMKIGSLNDLILAFQKNIL